MTREEIAVTILMALETAPPTTPKRVLQALKDAGQFIEDLALAVAPPLQAVPSQEGAELATAAPPVAALAKRLEEAAAIKISVHDSDSKIARINAERHTVMLEVARELRALS